tara:strand:+ start:1443 stop:1850 length:408 start_codon:yes stop_codon:yes gene_type:complete
MAKARVQNKGHHHRWFRCAYLLLYCLGLIGCGTIKKAGVVATAAGTGAIAGTVFSGGVAAPILGATTSAFVVDAITEVTSMSPTTMAECPAPVTGFWPLMGQVIETGGWLLAAVILVPLIMGYLIPNGLEKKKKT